MTIRDSNEFSGQFQQKMPKSVIPLGRTPVFMKALWALAVLMLIGTAYSFWRLSSVQNPRFDSPVNDEPVQPAPLVAPVPANSQPT